MPIASTLRERRSSRMHRALHSTATQSPPCRVSTAACLSFFTHIQARQKNHSIACQNNNSTATTACSNTISSLSYVMRLYTFYLKSFFIPVQTQCPSRGWPPRSSTGGLRWLACLPPLALKWPSLRQFWPRYIFAQTTSYFQALYTNNLHCVTLHNDSRFEMHMHLFWVYAYVVPHRSGGRL